MFYFGDVLKIRNEFCTYDQLEFSILDFIKRSQLRSKIEINYCTDRNDVYHGFSFVWFENKKIYNMLLGNNQDGSPRVMMAKNPNQNVKQQEFLRLSSSSGSLSWGEISDLEEELDDKYGPDEIKTKLKPLVELPKYKFTEKQKLKTKGMYGTFEFYKVKIKFPGENRFDNILFAQRVPNKISIKFLNKKFNKMVDSDFKIKEMYRGSNRCIQISFDKNNTDTQKIVLMFRKRYFHQNLFILNYQFKFGEKKVKNGDRKVKIENRK